ncbi:MAG: arsenic resistance protein [Persicimonas sp.]
MTLVEKLQGLIILLAVAAGLGLGQLPAVAESAELFILPFLVLMLLGVFLGVPLENVTDAFRKRRVTLVSLVFNFVWNPLFAWGLGWLFLSDHPALWVGLIMLMVTPCTDWYIVFTGIARGNVALSTALLPWNLLLQLILLPVYLYLLAGTLAPIDLTLLGESVLVALILPLAAAFGIRRLAVARKGEQWFQDRLLPRVQSTQILFLGLAIVAMFASKGAELIGEFGVFLRLLPPILVFFGFNLVLVFVLKRVFRIEYEDFVALCCTTLARNSPLALAIALVVFPDEPLIALALVIGPLIELPILGAVTQLLLRTRSDESSSPRS